MGLAACTHLVKRGYRVVIADINKEAGKKLSRELGSDVLFLSCDITHYEEQAALFKRAYDWGGRLDLLAANAGIPDRQSLYQDRASAPMGVNGLPLPLDLKAVEVCLESVIQAIWLFRFFARKSELSDVGKIIVTASAGGL
jgi:15-hydroxyprostaglandin dehydrogenase (NAD)